jgi:EpsI family protein
MGSATAMPLNRFFKTRTAVLVISLLGAVGLGHYLSPNIVLADTKAKVDYESLIPKAFGQWALDTQQPISVPNPELEAMLSSLYSQNIGRTYANAHGDFVMLAVAYTKLQTDHTQVHRPEVCYPSQGFEVQSQYDETLKIGTQTVPVRRMVTNNRNRNEYVTYWILVGEYAVVSTRDEKLKQIKYGLQRQIPDNLLFRVSTVGGDAAQAFAKQSAFIADMMKAVAPGALPSLIGRVDTPRPTGV